MPRTIPTPRFVLNIPKGKDEGYIRLEYRNQKGKPPVKINTGFKCTRKDWNTKEMRFVERSKEDIANNGQLARIGNAAKRVYMDGGDQMNRETFRDAVLVELGWTKIDQEQSPDLITYIHQYNQRRSAKPGENDNTVRHLRKFAGRMEAFLKWHRRKVEFEDVTLELMDRVITWGFEECQWNRNTLKRHLKYIQQYMNAANADGLHHNMICNSRSWIVKGSPVTKVVTYIEDLQQLSEYPFSHPSDIKVRDMYLIGCFTLMRISDFSRINPDMITTRAGKEYISVITEKTNSPVLIPLFPLLRDVLQKYSFQVPQVSNPYFNRRIKNVLKRAGFTQMVQVKDSKGGEDETLSIPFYSLITAHSARRSGATILYLSGVPTHVIRRLTGHKTDSQLMQYIVIGDKQAEQSMVAAFSPLKIAK